MFDWAKSPYLGSLMQQNSFPSHTKCMAGVGGSPELQSPCGDMGTQGDRRCDLNLWPSWCQGWQFWRHYKTWAHRLYLLLLLSAYWSEFVNDSVREQHNASLWCVWKEQGANWRWGKPCKAVWQNPRLALLVTFFKVMWSLLNKSNREWPWAHC